MVLTNETNHVYPYSWDVVTRAFWNKYPNKHLTHVERVDVLDRHIDAQGRLISLRLGKCTQRGLPTWVQSLFTASTYVFEETVCDPVRKTLTLHSTNLSLRSLASCTETCVYSVDPAHADQTQYHAEATITAFVPIISQKLESFSVSHGAKTAAKGISVVEGMCHDLFEGTCAPVTWCEARPKQNLEQKNQQSQAEH